MRHKRGNAKLGKPTDQRIALLRSLTKALFENKKICTTCVRAKETKRFAEKIITLGKVNSVFARRRALQLLPNKKAIQIAFNEIARQYESRSGGYSRLTHVGTRRGDAAKMVVLELLD